MGYEDETFTEDQMVRTDFDDEEDGLDRAESIVTTGTGYEYFLANDGKLKFSWRKLWQFTGPGFLMSIAYLDPGNLEADLQAGASGKFTLLWVLWWATVMGLLLQNIASMLGVVTGKHLAQHCATFPGPIRYTLWIMTEIALICADCQEVVGSAIAIHLLSDKKVPIYAGCLITAVDCFAFMLLDKKGMRKLEALFGIFISTMVITFGFQYFAKFPNQGDVFEGWVVPRMTSNANFQTAIGLVGAVIMPHNLYLHSALVLSRKIDRNFGQPDKKAEYKVKEAVFYNRLESTIALFVSFVINLFVVSVFAHLKYQDASGNYLCFYEGKPVAPDSSDCPDCIQIGLLNAGNCLKDIYNESWWLYIWALGLLAAGQASTITGTYAGQFVMEGFLDLKVKPAMRTFISRSFSLIPAMAVALLTPTHPDGMDNLNTWLNVAQSIQLPFAMLPVLFFGSCADRCRDWVVKGKSAIVIWTIAVIVLLSNVYAIYLTATDLPNHWYVWVIFSLFCLVYVFFVVYLLLVTLRILPSDSMPWDSRFSYQAIN
ncbi:Metal transporter Nramp4 [Diplonema papillatum]|nr:Metal transporter Nramp4 [Diplonema papillatum]